MRRFAPAERRSFSRLGRCRVFPMSGFSASVSSNVWTPSLNAVSLRSLISTPAMFQVPFSPCSVNSTRRKPSLQTRPPNTAGQFAPSVRLRCKRQGHLPDRRQQGPPTRPLRGESRPEEFPALKTASIGLRRRELRPQPRSRIVPWPPSRQGYFAPASRDAILLDGSLPATIPLITADFRLVSLASNCYAFPLICMVDRHGNRAIK